MFLLKPLIGVLDFESYLIYLVFVRVPRSVFIYLRKMYYE